MSGLYLLDTDTIVYLLRGKSPSVADRIRAVGDQRIGAAAIAFAELYYGAYLSARPRDNLLAVDAFRRRARVVPFDRRAAVLFGQIKAELRAIGDVLGDSDMFIAATALAAGATLVTNNVRHFRQVPDLPVENWVK